MAILLANFSVKSYNLNTLCAPDRKARGADSVKKLRAVGSDRFHGEALQATTAIRAVRNCIACRSTDAAQPSLIPARLPDRRFSATETITEEPV
jgi:hypothetical protein